MWNRTDMNLADIAYCEQCGHEFSRSLYESERDHILASDTVLGGRPNKDKVSKREAALAHKMDVLAMRNERRDHAASLLAEYMRLMRGDPENVLSFSPGGDA